MATIDDEVIDRRLAHLRRFMGTLKNCHPGNFQDPNRKCDFRFASFSAA
ncbi:hypothetical protein [Thioflavicoccus mobilis]|nr:hypothetical protein [Thioflavicoccus mobilis]